MFDSTFRWYGTVITFTPKGCSIEPPDSEYAHRVSYQSMPSVFLMSLSGIESAFHCTRRAMSLRKNMKTN